MLHMVSLAIALSLLSSTAEAGDQAQHFIKISDIAYRADDAKDDYARSHCKLDLYCPREKTGFATIVWFHGGGLRGGNRTGGEAFAKRFTKEGYGVVLASYRLSPKAKCPTYSEDAAAAVAWTIKHIKRHKGDPDSVLVSGHSASGYLTAMVGLDAKYLESLQRIRFFLLLPARQRRPNVPSTLRDLQAVTLGAIKLRPQRLA